MSFDKDNNFNFNFFHRTIPLKHDIEYRIGIFKKKGKGRKHKEY